MGVGSEGECRKARKVDDDRGRRVIGEEGQRKSRSIRKLRMGVGAERG